MWMFLQVRGTYVRLCLRESNNLACWFESNRGSSVISQDVSDSRTYIVWVRLLLSVSPGDLGEAICSPFRDRVDGKAARAS